MGCTYAGLGVNSHSCPQCVQSASLQCYVHRCSWDEFAKQPTHCPNKKKYALKLTKVNNVALSAASCAHHPPEETDDEAS